MLTNLERPDPEIEFYSKIYNPVEERRKTKNIKRKHLLIKQTTQLVHGIKKVI